MILKKLCTKCKEVKSVDEFYTSRNNLDGYRGKCKQCMREEDKEWYKSNKEHHNQCSALNYQKNAEEVIRRTSQHKRENKEQYDEIYARYVVSPKGQETIRRSQEIRKARIKAAVGHHTRKDVIAQGERQNWICYWQGTNCTGYCKDNFHKDHKIPVNRGGSNDPSNIVVSCPNCNRQKGNKTPEEYTMYLNKLKESKG